MIVFIGIGIFLLAFFLSLADLITNLIGTILIIIGVLLCCLPLLTKPQFEKRKLLRTYNILPIAPGVYAIKTCDEKVIFKYVDFEEDDKVIIDTLSSWNEIVEIEGNETPALNIYEQKYKKTWLTLPAVETRYIEVLKVPKNSIVTK